MKLVKIHKYILLSIYKRQKYFLIYVLDYIFLYSDNRINNLIAVNLKMRPEDGEGTSYKLSMLYSSRVRRSVEFAGGVPWQRARIAAIATAMCACTKFN